MSNDDFLQILKIEADEINTSFNKASITGRGTSQEVADTREAFVQQFVSRYFPFPFRTTKGKIRDSEGRISASIDCLILDANHPYTVDVQNKYSQIFCEGVESAIEVKPDVQNKLELERGLVQIKSVKELKRFKTSLLLNKDKDLNELAIRVPCFIFSIKAKSDPMETAKEIKEFYNTNNTPLELQLDALIINKVGIIRNYKLISSSPVNQFSDGTSKQEIGLYYEEYGELTLARFLILLNQMPSASPRLTEAILPRYLKNVSPIKILKI